jgi:hypothetical protein
MHSRTQWNRFGGLDTPRTARSSRSLANTLVLPLSTAILPPISIVQELQWPLVAIGLASRDHFYFNARGPPHA